MSISMQVRMLEEFNAWLLEREKRKCPCSDLLWKLKHAGWDPWKYVTYDEDTDQILFFELHEHYERWLAQKGRYLVEIIAEENEMTPERFWRLVEQLERLKAYILNSEDNTW